MTAAAGYERPHAPTPARAWLRPKAPFAAAFVVALAAMVLAPLASLAVFALHGDAEIWGHLVAYVIPVAMRDTALLLAGVAALTSAAGLSTAWLVTAYRFPGRDTLA